MEGDIEALALKFAKAIVEAESEGLAYPDKQVCPWCKTETILDYDTEGWDVLKVQNHEDGCVVDVAEAFIERHAR